MILEVKSLNLIIIFESIVTKGEGVRKEPKTCIILVEWTLIDFVYFIGNKIWDSWQESRRYIHNQINPHWKDPNTLASGYNITSLLLFIRDTCADHEATVVAKDNVRNHKNRIEKRGETFVDEDNNLFNC